MHEPSPIGRRWFLLAVGSLMGIVAYIAFHQPSDTFEVERTEYKLPAPKPDDVLTDDRLEDKQPAFDPTVVDRRPLDWQGWQLNASAAVIRLDVPMIKPDVEPKLLELFPSYAAAARQASAESILPSVNLLDGKAKQFDDGLYAALDQAYYQGIDGKLQSHVAVVRRLAARVGPASPAAPFLAAGLELAGAPVEVADEKRKDEWLADFNRDESRSKPIGFYTWNETLAKCFRFLRFFQYEFGPEELPLLTALAKALDGDPALRADYEKAVHFYARLTNLYSSLSVLDLAGGKPLLPTTLKELADKRGIRHPVVALFPPSTSREVELFAKLFAFGVPPNADLMRELIRRIRSGEVDLTPRPDSGWYDHQVYALETLLLPEKGEERNQLLLTKNYKQRMLEAFQALVTKHRETHVRQMYGLKTTSAVRAFRDVIRPRLRLEPCPSYYLRTARSYSFLLNFLDAALGHGLLQTLHGLRQGGPRQPNLANELVEMRDLFYGLYLVSAEDIGHKPTLAKDEVASVEHCYQLAVAWLPKALADPDLATDTRVALPIFVDYQRQVTRLWLTLGVRLSKLDAAYVRPPSVRPDKGSKWKPVEPHQLGSASFTILVDEFAEVELPGIRVLSRDEFRAVCGRAKTKAAILETLRAAR